MQERASLLASATQFPKSLIMVIEQDHAIGTRIVQLIRQETPFQAILATSQQQAHSILHHLTCDFFLLVDDPFLEEDMERLYLLPEEVTPPTLLNLTFNSSLSKDRDETDVKSLIKAVKLLLTTVGQAHVSQHRSL